MSHAADAHDHHAHPPNLAHHFDTPEQQVASGKLGMWIFLATEILLFGGLFCAYAVYRAMHPEIFDYAHLYLSKELGGVNTVVLLTSSLTMAWGVRAAQLGQKKILVWMLSLTLAFAVMFLGIKFVEYKAKWEEGLLPGKRFHPTAPPHVNDGKAAEPGHHALQEQMLPMMPGAAPAPVPPAVPPPAAAAAAAPADPAAAPAGPKPGELSSLIQPAPPGPPGLAAGEVAPLGAAKNLVPKNVQIFFGIYFMMTGLHALHVLAGMAVIAWLLKRSLRGEFGPAYFAPVDLGGLYWHLVDLIWIFLFPLMYLIH
ncbi:MAG: cytochrome c oxidase subunit 3 [Acidobacteria bacterium]|nr:cytochrome c oxidase subunit 3 [Acidobacteriota bacterium]